MQSQPEASAAAIGDLASFHEVVARTRHWYEQREQDAIARRRWAPFQEAEVAGRCQQYRQLAALLRECSVLSLEGKRVLDVGCGTGRAVRAFVDWGADPAQVCGIDIMPPSIEAGRRLAPHLRLELFDGVGIPFGDASYDLVTQFVCFSSILSPELRRHLAQEMWRVLAPGGYVFWWDLLRTQGPSAHDRDHLLDVGQLFPDVPCRELRVAVDPWPDECLRPGRGAWPLESLVRLLRPQAVYCAARLGPK